MREGEAGAGGGGHVLRRFHDCPQVSDTGSHFPQMYPPEHGHPEGMGNTCAENRHEFSMIAIFANDNCTTANKFYFNKKRTTRSFFCQNIFFT